MKTYFNFQFSKTNGGRLIFPLLILFLFVSCLVAPAEAQRRDHLNAYEIELIRDQQSADLRMLIYLKAINRRLLVLNNDQTQAKQIEKDLDRWGELPTGTRMQILIDIEKILEESISKVDDLAARDMKSRLLPVAVNILAEGANKLVPMLRAELDKTNNDKEKGAILGALEYCSQIIEASAKVPKLTEKEIKRIQKEVEKEIVKSQQSN